MFRCVCAARKKWYESIRCQTKAPRWSRGLVTKYGKLTMWTRRKSSNRRNNNNVDIDEEDDDDYVTPPPKRPPIRRPMFEKEEGEKEIDKKQGKEHDGNNNLNIPHGHAAAATRRRNRQLLVQDEGEGEGQQQYGISNNDNDNGDDNDDLQDRAETQPGAYRIAANGLATDEISYINDTLTVTSIPISTVTPNGSLQQNIGSNSNSSSGNRNNNRNINSRIDPSSSSSFSVTSPETSTTRSRGNETSAVLLQAELAPDTDAIVAEREALREQLQMEREERERERIRTEQEIIQKHLQQLQIQQQQEQDENKDTSNNENDDDDDEEYYCCGISISSKQMPYVFVAGIIVLFLVAATTTGIIVALVLPSSSDDGDIINNDGDDNYKKITTSPIVQPSMIPTTNPPTEIPSSIPSAQPSMSKRSRLITFLLDTEVWTKNDLDPVQSTPFYQQAIDWMSQPDDSITTDLFYQIELLDDQINTMDTDTITMSDSNSNINNNINDIIQERERYATMLFERFVVVYLYYHFNGPNWDGQDGFLQPSVSICQWNVPHPRYESLVYGISCDDDINNNDDENENKHYDEGGMVQSLNLEFNNIDRPIPTEIGLLTHLTSLELRKYIPSVTRCFYFLFIFLAGLIYSIFFWTNKLLFFCVGVAGIKIKTKLLLFFFLTPKTLPKL